MAIIGISGKIGSGKDTVGRIIQYITLENGERNIWNTFDKYIGDIPEHHPMNNWQVKKFARKLKEFVASITGCTVEDLESQEFKNKQLGEEWNYYKTFQSTSDGTGFIRSTPTEEAKKMLPFPERIKPYTYREMLQRVGTEAMRNCIHENIWCNALFADYKNGMSSQFGIFDIKNRERNFEPIGKPIKHDYPNWIITDMRFPNELSAVKERGGITIRLNRPKPKVSTGNKITDHVLNETKDFGIVEHPSETALDNATFDYVIDNDGTIKDLIQKVREILIKENIL